MMPAQTSELRCWIECTICDPDEQEATKYCRSGLSSGWLTTVVNAVSKETMNIPTDISTGSLDGTHIWYAERVRLLRDCSQGSIIDVSAVQGTERREGQVEDAEAYKTHWPGIVVDVAIAVSFHRLCGPAIPAFPTVVQPSRACVHGRRC